VLAERTPRLVNRARLTAAASSLKSWATRTRPRTRARRPPWRRRSRCASLRSTLGRGPGRRPATQGRAGGNGRWPARPRGEDGHDSAAEAAGAHLAQRTDAARDAEPGMAPAPPGRADGHGHPGRTGHRPSREVDAELVLGEAAAGCGRELGLDHRREPLLLQPGQMGAGAISAVAVDHRPRRLSTALALWGEVAQQRRCDRRIAGGRHRDLRCTDDLAVGVDRHMRLVAINAMGGGLVP
jgi:hypothetical protein